MSLSRPTTEGGRAFVALLKIIFAIALVRYLPVIIVLICLIALVTAGGKGKHRYRNGACWRE
jgi:hypothetical protein